MLNVKAPDRHGAMREAGALKFNPGGNDAANADVIVRMNRF